MHLTLTTIKGVTVFVSLKNRIGVGMAAAVLLALSACGDSSELEASPQSTTVPTTSIFVAPPVQMKPEEPMYTARPNWPNIMVEKVMSYRSGDRLCVDVVACVQEQQAVLKAAQFVGNAFSKGMSFPSEITAADLKEWREVAVVNVCFEDSWEAYVGGALLFFAYEDDADVSDYGRVMNQFDLCKNADVLQKPQP